ncbi:MAG TPA: hypothetical protein VMK31_00800 [Sphingomicrobium sp.]|nr:hypothetical protein [Sphingomicrobium sp.]
MRIILFILIVLVVGLLIALASGLLSITQTQPARTPEVQIGSDGVGASGGQAPAFDIETGTVSIEETTRNVPTLNVRPAEQGGEDNQGNSATQPPAPAASQPAAPAE